MPRPSMAGFLANWRDYDAPVWEKLRLATKNNLIKLRRGSSCCGNHGEPGC